MFLTKSLLVSLGKLKFQSMFIPFWGIILLLKLKINGWIVWMFWKKWNGIIIIRPTLLAVLKHNCVNFILSYFIGQFALISFSTKSVEQITPTVIFAVVSLNLFYPFFANVKKFLPSGMSYVSWLIISLGKHLICLILITCLALLISQSMTIVLISFLCVCVWNFTFTDANFSWPPLILMHFWI